ncbi:MAG: TatD family hydrolase [Ignavibacteriales bacterium]|nr:TatD family hydrolase [Ignavibacteriales bacterium]
MLEYVRMGHMISFTGNITFKKAEELRKFAAKVHPEHLLMETDSPFMTPCSIQGKGMNRQMFCMSLKNSPNFIIFNRGRYHTNHSVQRLAIF